jgi:hypothetical protein
MEFEMVVLSDTVENMFYIRRRRFDSDSLSLFGGTVSERHIGFM